MASDVVLTHVSGFAKRFAVSVTDDSVPFHELLCTIVRPPSNGTVTLTYPTYYPKHTCYRTYTSTNGFTGQDSFTVKANDGELDSSIATVNIQVNSNQPPVVQDCAVTGIVGSVINIMLWASDDALYQAELTCSVVQPPSNGTVATFVRQDNATLGDWQAAYGADGYWMPRQMDNNGRKIYASFTPPCAQIRLTSPDILYGWTCADPATDTRALRHIEDSGRIMSDCNSGGGVPICWDLNFVDGRTHRVAIHIMDWGFMGARSNETVSVIDSLTGAVLDTRTVTNLTSGTYLVWDIQGRVTIQLLSTACAVFNGLFFGGPGLDSNHDGLPDDWQIARFGSIIAPAASPWADPDRDGQSNLQEWMAGFDPNDPASHLQFRSLSGEPDGMGFDFETAAGRWYDVYWKTNLTDTSHWEHCASVLGIGGPVHVTFTNRVAQGFFQVQLSP